MRGARAHRAQHRALSSKATRTDERRHTIGAAALLATALTAGAAETVQHVVAIGGVVTKVPFALGRGDRPVAVDSTSSYPEAARSLPR